MPQTMVAIDGTFVSFSNVPLGVLSGVIKSAANGDNLSGVKVEAWKSAKKETFTGDDGQYSMDLPEGTWTLRASNLGFIPVVEGGVNVIANQTSNWNADLEPIPVPLTGTVVLNNGDSYDFATGQRGLYTGGDFYLSALQFWANNQYQRGLLDLGDIGDTPLDEVVPPDSGYSRFGVEVVLGHTYVSLAHEGEEGCFIIFRVTSIDTGSVALNYNFIILGDDSDGDGIPDFIDPDDDNDGLTDEDEIIHNTNPTNPDSDGDGMPDGWEVDNDLNPLVNDAGLDSDDDGLSNRYEYGWRENVVFVTSVTGNGNLSSWPDAGGNTGLEAADAICQTRADSVAVTRNV